MKLVYQSDLSRQGINNLIGELRKYRDNRLPEKQLEFIERLARIGVREAEASIDGTRYVDYVVFETEVVVNDKHRKVILMFGRNKEMMHREWYMGKNANMKREADVNPILMAEFGSGEFADISGYENAEGLGGRGTFPGQHVAFLSYWNWYEKPNDSTTDPDTLLPGESTVPGLELHESSGEKPSAPLKNACEAMAVRITKIADAVFNS